MMEGAVVVNDSDDTTCGDVTEREDDITKEYKELPPPSPSLIRLIGNTTFANNDNNYYSSTTSGVDDNMNVDDDFDDDAETVGAISDQEERDAFVKQNFTYTEESNRGTSSVLFIGENPVRVSSSSATVSDDDGLVNTTLKFYQRADTSFPSFKHALARKVNFQIPYVKHELVADEEDALLTAEVVPLLNSEIDSRSMGLGTLDVPHLERIEKGFGTSYSNIEATKLFSLNLGLEKVFQTRINDNEFEEEFGKIFFSVYGEDAKQIFNIVGKIIEEDKIYSENREKN